MGLLGKALRLVSDMEKASGEQARLVDGACAGGQLDPRLCLEVPNLKPLAHMSPGSVGLGPGQPRMVVATVLTQKFFPIPHFQYPSPHKPSAPAAGPRLW